MIFFWRWLIDWLWRCNAARPCFSKWSRTQVLNSCLHSVSRIGIFSSCSDQLSHCGVVLLHSEHSRWICILRPNLTRLLYKDAAAGGYAPRLETEVSDHHGLDSPTAADPGPGPEPGPASLSVSLYVSQEHLPQPRGRQQREPDGEWSDSLSSIVQFCGFSANWKKKSNKFLLSIKGVRTPKWSC